ncbi:MAG: galactosyldiacylglycerol synthase, partial [Planctomycetes bacterium]|nr:galactosyldiacylglycerol synthase [Planctomycetota bacterium]
MKLLIVSTSVGSGHVRAAAALEETARELHPDVQVKHVDMMQYVSPIYRALYAGTYLPLTNRTPQFWGYLYKRTDVARAARRQAKIIRAYDALQFRHFRAMVAEYAPDVMIATHFLPLQVYEPLRTEGKISWPLVVVLTDFDAHVLWAQFTGDR